MPGPGSAVGRLTLIAVAVLLIGGGVAVGRWSAPQTHSGSAGPAAPVGIAYSNGVPTGFPATVRGAGDAAAWFETLLADVGSEPSDRARALIAALVAPDAGNGLVDALMPSTGRVGNTNISQTVVARVWAAGSSDPTTLTDGVRVDVETYGVGLFGPRTDGAIAGPDAGLAGGWVVHPMTLEFTPHGWALFQVHTPAPAPPPDVRGATRDGSPRDTQVLARVLGPDSWIPEMP
ncbi:hypothetical protein Raf01_71370 [Rugosimonospora africana]|uniref:Uncharacterized protein n=1 Tax=Rugosimonospora africana TaxID=556532 RepID=A0A8J3R078_9ACTN|nr:hypothetical protein Raf01_71370 [Rugosimonospora africana]